MPEAIAETIRVGINSAHPETRMSQMPAFGRDGMLNARRDARTSSPMCRASSDPAAIATRADKIAAGKAVFATNCAACHGDDAKGNPELGAPEPDRPATGSMAAT